MEQFDFLMDILERGEICEQETRFIEASYFYSDAIDYVLAMSPEPNEHSVKQVYNRVLDFYNDRAKKIRKDLQKRIQSAALIKTINIEENATGFNYETIFLPHISNSSVTEVIINEPMMETKHHFKNMTMLLELIVKNCKHLKFLVINTKRSLTSPSEQNKMLDSLTHFLTSKRIGARVIFDNDGSKRIIFEKSLLIDSDTGIHFFQPISGQIPDKLNLASLPCVASQFQIYNLK